MPSCSQPSRTLRASGPKGGPSLTAAARAGISSVQVGTEGWCRSNKRMGPKKAEPQNQAKSPTRFHEEAFFILALQNVTDHVIGSTVRTGEIQNDAFYGSVLLSQVHAPGTFQHETRNII